MKTTIHHKSPSWANLIEKWQQSSLSQSEFCRRHELSLTSFSYHKRKLLDSPPPPEIQELNLPVKKGIMFDLSFEPTGIDFRFKVRL